MEINMKTALILSTLAVFSVISTASFAENFVAYSGAFGSADSTVTSVAPVASHFGASDFGYQVARRTHRAWTAVRR
jgi:hypothetical protein